MHRHIRIGSLLSTRLFLVAIVGLLAGPLRAQTNEVGNAPVVTNSSSANDELAHLTMLQLQALTEFQTQMQAMVKSLEKNRMETANMLAQNASNNVANLASIADMMASQRADDLRVVRDEHRIGMAIVVGLAGLLILSILFLNVTAIKALNRMTILLSGSTLTPGAEAQALADARERELQKQRQLALFPGEPGQVGNAVGQLQSRIQHLEAIAKRPRPESTNSGDIQISAEEKASHRIR